MPCLLRLDGITKSFGAVRALRGVSFELRAGEVHALLGENGAGKSTLIKVITGAHDADEGTIMLDGCPLERLTPLVARGLGIACIYQQPALFPDLTVAENFAIRLEPVGLFRRVDRVRRRVCAKALLRKVGANFSPDLVVRMLSMPEQQLVELACAVGAGARVVVMDEPTASLTRREQEILFGLVRTLKGQGVGVIYISHRLDEIFELADRVTVLRDGESVGTFPMAEVDEGALIRHMVGREVIQMFPRAEGTVGEVVMSVRGITCFSGGVEEVSFELRAGEILGLAGLVGSGRTELARVLFGLTPADGGEIRIDGQVVEIPDPRKAMRLGIAYVPEDRRRHGVVPAMSVLENLVLASQAWLSSWGWIRNDRERVLAQELVVALSVKAEGVGSAVGTLSGGNQQKVALGRWLATRPKVLILDEPTQGVDVGAKAEIHRIMRRLAAEGMAVLMISSDLPEVMGMSDRVLVMRGGRLAGELPRGAVPEAVMAMALGVGSREGGIL